MSHETSHRLWLIEWSRRTGKYCSQQTHTIFQNRMQALLGRSEREEPTEPVLLESLRLREITRLQKEIIPK